MSTTPERRPLLVSRRWLQASAFVFVLGFFLLGLLGALNYRDKPPIPEEVLVDGEVLFTEADVMAGQQGFLRNGLMEYGSVLGHGAYLGPDFTADYLHREIAFLDETLAGEGAADPEAELREILKTNRYDPDSGALQFTPLQADAFAELTDHYADFFGTPSTEYGLRREAITDPEEIRQLTAFFGWTAWAAAAQRPDKDYSYTNNWPPEPSIGNTATGDALVWSALSIIALLAGTGFLLGLFGRYNWLGWHGRDNANLRFRRPDEVRLTPAQRATAWFFLLMGLLFLLQTLVGSLTAHYRADLSSFFGFDLAQLIPYTISRTWHVQLSIFWVSTSFLAAGIFLLPLISRGEPRGQNVLAYVLLAALGVVVFGSLGGEWLGQRDVFGDLWAWFGHQGFEYLDLGRLWQVLLTLGLFFWVAILFRGLRTRLRSESYGNMPWLFFYAGLAIPVFYAVGLLATPDTHFTITDYWRFWVVHLWVEDFLELFTTAMVAFIFVLLGVVAMRTALVVVYLDIILYSVGGVVGTMHHLYFSGTPAATMAMGAFFSAAEVIPLTLLTVEAWSFLRLGTAQGIGRGRFPHYWAVMFLVAVGFWNFLGAGVFGFLINLPIVSYYEIGTALTANHAHAAMMGVYGMLAAGLALFCLRYLMPESRWSERAAKTSFWSLNIGLAWMSFVSLFPLGVLQLYESVNEGYWEARTLQYLTSTTNTVLEWLRLPGDVLFIVGGALPLLWLTWRGVRYCRACGPEGELGTTDLFVEEPEAGV